MRGAAAAAEGMAGMLNEDPRSLTGLVDRIHSVGFRHFVLTPVAPGPLSARPGGAPSFRRAPNGGWVGQWVRSCRAARPALLRG